MHERQEPLPCAIEDVAKDVVEASIEIHRTLGPGLLGSVCESCLAHEVVQRERTARRQVGLPVVYEAVELDGGYGVGLLVDDVVIVEVEAAEAVAPVHEAQLLTYLKLSGRRLGFLINFNVAFLKQGIRRMTL